MDIERCTVIAEVRPVALGTLAAVLAGIASTASVAEPPTESPAPPIRQSLANATGEDRLERMQAEIDALKAANERQAGEIGELRTERGEQWLSEQRASQIRGIVGDVLADASSRAALETSGAVAGYDKTFFLASTDGNFKLNIRGQLQVRWSFNNVPTVAASLPTSQSASEYGFELRRAKLFFSGHVVDPTWKYMLEIAYGRNGGAGGNQVSLESAYIEKDLGGGTFIRVGEWLQQFNQEEMVSSGAQQFVERSLVNSYFSVKYVQGAEIGTQQEWWRVFGGVNDGGANQDIQVIQASNLVEWAVTARGEIKIGGSWDQFRGYQGWIGAETAFLLGAGVNWQRGTGVQGIRNVIGNGTIPGAPGGGEPASLITYTADATLLGSGWSVSAAGYGNLLYNFAPTPLVRGDVQSFGVTVQGGVFLTKELELAARYEGLWVTNGIRNATTPNALNNQTLNIVTVGGTVYFNRNQLKITTDVGYAFNAVRFNTGIYGEGLSGADWRPTLNAATAGGGGSGEIVVRSQMQLLF